MDSNAALNNTFTISRTFDAPRELVFQLAEFLGEIQ